MYYYSKKLYFISSICFLLSGLVRANGLLYSGFFLFTMTSQRVCIFSRIKLLFYAMLVLIPFFSFQYLGTIYFCKKNPQPWCGSQLIYQYVQKKYWDNGWLAYYKVKQIPNFIIASPFLILTVYGLYNYISADFIRFMTLGYKTENLKSPAMHSRLLPFFYLWAFMLFMVSTAMHVQVILRFFTCLPPLYWTMAEILKVESIKRMILLSYLLIWSLVGIVLFSNFYPPA
jgi:phosphatidylinositol glycan class V